MVSNQIKSRYEREKNEKKKKEILGHWNIAIALIRLHTMHTIQYKNFNKINLTILRKVVIETRTESYTLPQGDRPFPHTKVCNACVNYLSLPFLYSSP